jgi:hypothetical protein
MRTQIAKPNAKYVLQFDHNPQLSALPYHSLSPIRIVHTNSTGQVRGIQAYDRESYAFGK